ncbi:MAG: heterocyst frequency control protein PatD [Leptolyngbyaceae bacterium]|nr:heterocyst frequency control protein PatD [Leptolyngbyaceae bacterium]
MYQRLQQKLQKIQDFVQRDLDGLTGESYAGSPKQDGRGFAVGADPGRGEGLVQSSQELVQVLVEVKQLWGELQAQPPSHSRWQSLCTEMHKQLRLAEIDVQFWVAARQSGTALRRGQQLCDRLSTLIGYCDAGIKLNQQNR